MTLVGRQSELAHILSIATAQAEGALLVVGDHGLGKSSLIDAALGDSPVKAVVIRTNAAEAAWPLSGFSSLFASIDDPRAIEFGGRFALRSTDPDDMFVAAQDLLSVLRGLALDRIVVLVDDIDLMDPESQILIGIIAGRLAGTGICLIATATRLDVLSPLRGLSALTLEPLDFDECLKLATMRAGETSDDGTMRIVAAQSLGNPLAVCESVRLLEPDQICGKEPLLLPFKTNPVIQDETMNRLGHLSADRWRILERLSLAPVNHEVVLSLGEDEAADVLDDLVYEGLVLAQGAYLQIKNPLLRSNLFWRLDAKSRRELHHDQAVALEGIDERLVSWHRSFTSLADTSTIALLEAAISFAQEGNVPAAIEIAERALATGSGSEDILALTIELAHAFFLLGDLSQASRYLVLASRGPSSPSLLLKIATLKMRIDYFRVQRAPDQDVGAWVGMYSDDHPDGAAQLLSLAAALQLDRWNVEGSRALLAQVEPLLKRVEPATRAYNEGVKKLIDITEGRQVGPLVVLDDADRELAVSSHPMELIQLGQMLSLTERYADARRVYAIMLNRHPSPAPVWIEATRFLAVENEIRSGSFTEVLFEIEEWESSSPPQQVRRSSRLLIRAWYLYLVDRVDESREILTGCLELASHVRNQVVVARAFALQGAIALVERRGEDALRQLDLAEVASAAMHNPSVLRHSVDRIEAFVMGGRQGEAKAEYELFRERLRARPSRWGTLAVARARAAVTGDGDSIELFREALALFEETDSPYELGRTWNAFADALERMGHREESQKAWISAQSVFEIADAGAWSHAAASRITVLSETGENPLLALLSTEEREVVQKVRQGYRNREIADALYISLRTVELRLTHVYRKLGARSRSHLMALMT